MITEDTLFLSLERRKYNRRICPNCLEEVMRLIETDHRKAPAIRGALQAIRTFECQPCHVIVRCYEICVGTVLKRSSRAQSRARTNDPEGRVVVISGQDPVDAPLVVKLS